MANKDGRPLLGFKQCPGCAKKGQDTSQDNLLVYENGANCRACGYDAWKEAASKGETWSLENERRGMKIHKANKKSLPMVETSEITSPLRGISPEVLSKYNIKREADDSDVIVFEQYVNGKLEWQKLRREDKKPLWKDGATMQMRGSQQGLIGKEACGTPNTGIGVIITEGEFDMAAAHQMMGWPCVTMGGASDIGKIEQDLEWLMQWRNVILCFDADAAGEAATAKALELFDPGFAKVTKLPPGSDPNQMLQEGRVKVFEKCIFNSSFNRPKCLLRLDEYKDEILELPEVGDSWPWAGLNEMSFGMRKAHVYSFIGDSAVGKTEFLKDIVFHRLEQNKSVGLFSFEDTRKDAALKILSSKMKVPLLNPKLNKLDSAQRKDFENVISEYSKNLTIYDSSLGWEWEDIKRNIQVAVRCDNLDLIVIDNLTMLAGIGRIDNKRVSEIEMASLVVHELKHLAVKLNIVVCLVAHVNRNNVQQSQVLPSIGKSVQDALNVSLEDRQRLMNMDGTTWETGRVPYLKDIKGGQAVGQISSFVLSLSRNRMSKDSEKKRTLQVTLIKTREDSAHEGHDFKLIYNPDRLRLEEIEDIV